MGRAGIGAPGAATQEGMPELALEHEHFQHHIRRVANEALIRDGASAATGEAIAVCNVAEVGKLARAVADGAGGSFVNDGGHGWFLKRGASPLMRELYSMAKQGLSAPLLHGNILLQRSVPMVAVELFSVPDAHGAVELAVPQPFFTIAVLLNAEALDGSLH